jgi:hypothetical protein
MTAIAALRSKVAVMVNHVRTQYLFLSVMTFTRLISFFQGLWSWLGYSPPTKNDPDPPRDKPTNTTKAEPSSSSAPPVPKRPPSWHSYFFQTHSNTTLEKDSVIVEPTLKSQDELLGTASRPPPPANNAPSTNIVLPSIQSQFSVPPSPQTFFGRAIHAIHSMFTPAQPDIIQQMKTHPDTVAGKKFVVIGIHGWFPAKVMHPRHQHRKLIFSLGGG